MLQVLETKQSDEALLVDRIKNSLIKSRLLHRNTTDRHIAYERATALETTQSISNTPPFQTELFQAATSEDRDKQEPVAFYSEKTPNHYQVIKQAEEAGIGLDDESSGFVFRHQVHIQNLIKHLRVLKKNK